MSFGINGPDPTPAIQPSHQTSDGGAGNLGYFQREKKKKEQEDENDTLELSSKKEEDNDEGTKDKLKKLNSIGSKIKTFWFNFHGIFNEAVEDNPKEEEKDE